MNMASSTAKALNERLLQEVSDNVLKKYGTFLDMFNANASILSERNCTYLIRSISLPSALHNGINIADEFAAEKTNLVQLLKTCGNMELNKTLSIFSSLIAELKQLSLFANNELAIAITLHGINNSSDGASSPTHSSSHRDENELNLMNISKLLPTLLDLIAFRRRSFDLISNCLEQMNALIALNRQSSQSPNKSIVPQINPSVLRLDMLWSAISDHLVAIINIDELLTSSTLKSDFVNYKRIIELVVANPSKFELQSNQKQIRALFLLLMTIEGSLIDAPPMFKQLIDLLSSSVAISGEPILVGKNNHLADQIASYLRNVIADFDSSQDLHLTTHRSDHKLLGIVALFLLYVWLFKKDDRRLLKSLVDLEKKTSLLVVHLSGNITVLPDRLLQIYLPKSMQDKKQFDLLNQQRESLLKLSTNLDKDYKSMAIKVVTWMLKFEETMVQVDGDPVKQNLVDLLHKQERLLDEGLEIVFQISYQIKTVVNLHVMSSKAMSKAHLVTICQMISMLKGIQVSFECMKGSLFQVLTRSAQFNSCIVLSNLSTAKKRMLADCKKYSEKKLDSLSAIILAANCIHGPLMDQLRLILSSLCISFCAPEMNSEELNRVTHAMNKMELFSNLYHHLNQYANCDFIYFTLRPVLPMIISHFYEHDQSNVMELNYFLLALSDCADLLESNKTLDASERSAIVSEFEENVTSLLKSEFLDKICADFETELRLQIHSHLQLDDQSPFKRRLDNFHALITKSQPIRFRNRIISIKHHVEQHLNEIAYNLTTIALHDWKTYENMLNLARNKYDLDFIRSQLPTQTLEQGLDVLEITRNIHIFVAKYLYNLNNQMFIERSSQNKHLNVLLIRHVANSIQTHGFGVINTAVNFTYQFLRRKFHIFSQFLYEDHIKSRLLKDLRFFRTEVKSQKFPFERAEKFMKGIRKLGLTVDGLSFLDQFRLLITQVGNALGFVRMLRSGALHCSSNSINFVPDLDINDEQPTFESICREEFDLGEADSTGDNPMEGGTNDKFFDTLITAAKQLDSVIHMLNKSFTESTDYFKLLVDVFAPTFRDEKNYHLRTFYVILPALTYNFVEHIIISKEKMTRKNKVGAAFTDDGFAMGVAYILRLLDQYVEFDSLHWFSSVKEKIAKEREEAIKQRNAANSSTVGDEKLTQTISLTLRRLDVLQKEFELLNYNLTSCRILFRGSTEL